MLKSKSLLEKLRYGSTGPFMEGFARDLLDKDFSSRIICAHLRAATHFTHWVAGLDLSLSDLKEDCIESFCAHLDRCQCRRTYKDRSSHTIAGARYFLAYLQSQGIIPQTNGVKHPIIHPLWEGFEHWMRRHRGVLDSTLAGYRRFITALIEHLGDDFSHLNPSEIRAFILKRSDGSKMHSARSLITATRMFLRYLMIEGLCPSDWEPAIPRVACRRLCTLPRYLPQEDIQRIVSACHHATAKTGIRNRAIVLLCARMGLRVGEIIKLRLSDIDWLGASLRVLGKGGREARMPLTQEIGDALLTYVEHARPPLQKDHLFVTAYPPWRPLGASSSASSIVARLIRRSGVKPATRGAAHLLRHSAATEMLRQGSSLQDIRTILRHRSLETTAIYAKVDFNALHQIAQPWPGGESC